MYFQGLQLRLIATIRQRVRSGELTERSLARLTGISQPHIHNVLKGVRILSPEMADQILRKLRIDLFDLLDPPEWKAPRSGLDLSAYQEVPVLEGLLGPGHPMPSAESRFERYPFPRRYLVQMINPVLVRVAEDPCIVAAFRPDDLVLLDRSPLKRREPEPNCYYVIHSGDQAIIRGVRMGGGRLYLLSQDCRDDPPRWQHLSLVDQFILDIIRGKVVWVSRNLELPIGTTEPNEEAG